jgi:hypothetical protein
MSEIFNGNPYDYEIIISALRAIPPICAVVKVAMEVMCRRPSSGDDEQSDERGQPYKPLPKKHVSKAVESCDHE